MKEEQLLVSRQRLTHFSFADIFDQKALTAAATAGFADGVSDWRITIWSVVRTAGILKL
jgi:hypothetical protein